MIRPGGSIRRDAGLCKGPVEIEGEMVLLAPYSENTLKLIGSGCGRNHFQWAIPGIDYTPAAVNIGQAFTTCP
jgi:hypothetical protein